MQTETYGWTGQKISEQDNTRQEAFGTKSDPAIYVPLLTRRSLIRDGNLHDTRYSNHDAHGNPGRVQQSGPNSSSATRYAYDGLGRVTAITHADGTRRGFAYGGYGLDTVTDERGQQLRHRYRSFGDPEERWLTAIESPALASANLAISRNGLGQVTELRQNGVSRRYGYDSRCFLTSSSEPEASLTTYGRDAVGNLIARTTAGATATYSYDGLGRLRGITYPSGTPAARFDHASDLRCGDCGKSGESSYDYDAEHRLVRARRAGLTTYYLYGHDGDLLFESEPSRGLSREHAYLGGHRLATRTLQ